MISEVCKKCGSEFVPEGTRGPKREHCYSCVPKRPWINGSQRVPKQRGYKNCCTCRRWRPVSDYEPSRTGRSVENKCTQCTRRYQRDWSRRRHGLQGWLPVGPLRDVIVQMPLTIAALASRSGIPERTIYRIKNAQSKVRIRTAETLLHHLGYEMWEVYPDE